MSRLEGAFEQIVERLGDMSARLETLEIKVDGNYHALDAKIESKFTTMDAKFESKLTTMDAKFRFLVGLYVSSTLTIVAAVLATVLPLYSRLPPLH